MKYSLYPQLGARIRYTLARSHRQVFRLGCKAGFARGMHETCNVNGD